MGEPMRLHSAAPRKKCDLKGRMGMFRRVPRTAQMTITDGLGDVNRRTVVKRLKCRFTPLLAQWSPRSTRIYHINTLAIGPE